MKTKTTQAPKAKPTVVLGHICSRAATTFAGLGLVDARPQSRVQRVWWARAALDRGGDSSGNNNSWGVHLCRDRASSSRKVKVTKGPVVRVVSVRCCPLGTKQQASPPVAPICFGPCGRMGQVVAPTSGDSYCAMPPAEPERSIEGRRWWCVSHEMVGPRPCAAPQLWLQERLRVRVREAAGTPVGRYVFTTLPLVSAPSVRVAWLWSAGDPRCSGDGGGEYRAAAVARHHDDAHVVGLPQTLHDT